MSPNISLQPREANGIQQPVGRSTFRLHWSVPDF